MPGTPVLTRPGRAVPPRALALAVVCLLTPLVTSGVLPEWSQEQELLVWLPALIPAFLLTYYRGWYGASLALAGGMVALALVQVEIFVLGLPAPPWSVLFGVILMLVTVSLGSGWATERLHREREEAEVSALTDPLTGLPNRRHATVFLEAAWAAAHRGRDLSVVLLDIDHFKQVNDTRGHAQGDEVLCRLADALARRTRGMDLSARFGGEEFLSILVDCTAEEAVHFAEEVRSALSEHDFGWGRVTVSAGVATFVREMGGPDVLMATADQALYAAKEGGRDQVVLAGSRTSAAAEPRTLEAPHSLAEVEILLVAADPSSLRRTKRSLASLGCEVRAFSDPREALSSTQEGELAPDLVVTDLVMPEMSGFTLVELLGRVRPGLPVIYVSAYPKEEVYWGGAPGATRGFLPEPFTNEELEGELLRALGIGA